MIVKDNSSSDALTIPLDLARCMMHFRHRSPTTEEIATLKHYYLTQGDEACNTS
jgi:hypothetical protein